jgi:hypothetical protein
MFPPNATDQDEWDYHDSEADYHISASKVCTERSEELIVKASYGINVFGGWRALVDRASRSTELARHHNTMAKFHITRMNAIGEVMDQ